MVNRASAVEVAVDDEEDIDVEELERELYDAIYVALKAEAEGRKLTEDEERAAGEAGEMLCAVQLIRSGLSMDTVELMLSRDHHLEFSWKKGATDDDDATLEVSLVFDRAEGDNEIVVEVPR